MGISFPRAAWLPRPEDEFLHEPTGDPAMAWKETSHFNVFDLDEQFAISVHMTLSANRKPNSRIAVVARLGGRETGHVRRETAIDHDSTLGNSLVRVEILNSTWDDDHHLRLVGDLPDAEFDITLRGHRRGVLWDTMFPGFYQAGRGDSHTYGHAEQSLRFEGTFAWRGEAKRTLSGVGWRDRGWGRRASATSFPEPWDFAVGWLPDGATFTMCAFRQIELPLDVPLPIGVWYSDRSGTVAAVGGRFEKDSAGWPTTVDLTLEDGRQVESKLQRRGFTIAPPWHDVDHERSSVSFLMREYFNEFIDAEGNTFPLYTIYGAPHLTDVTAAARFVAASA